MKKSSLKKSYKKSPQKHKISKSKNTRRKRGERKLSELRKISKVKTVIPWSYNFPYSSIDGYEILRSRQNRFFLFVEVTIFFIIGAIMLSIFSCSD
jgi:hypothetical protein